MTSSRGNQYECCNNSLACTTACEKKGGKHAAWSEIRLSIIMKLSGLQRAAQLGKCSLSGPNEAVIISRVTQMQSSEAASSRLGREKQKNKVFPGLGVADVGSDVEAKRGLGVGSPNHPPPSPGLQLPCEHFVTGDRCHTNRSSVPGSYFYPSQQRVNCVGSSMTHLQYLNLQRSLRHPQKGHPVHALNGGNRDDITSWSAWKASWGFSSGTSETSV